MICDIKECGEDAIIRMGHLFFCKKHMELHSILIPELEKKEIEK